MFRILLANFITMVLPLLLIAAGILLVTRSRPETRGKRYCGIAFISLPVGVVVYIIAGIMAASIRGDGHFYSVPFGGYSVSDNIGIVASAATWTAIVFLVLAAILRPRQG